MNDQDDPEAAGARAVQETGMQLVSMYVFLERSRLPYDGNGEFIQLHVQL
jgi:hypothetical protein